MFRERGEMYIYMLKTESLIIMGEKNPLEIIILLESKNYITEAWKPISQSTDLWHNSK